MFTHRCDYCGERYSLPDGEDVSVCKTCGEFRIYNLRENRPSAYYQKSGSEDIEPPPVEEEETPPKKTKKQSKDLKAKRTSPSYAETVRQRYGYKKGS